MSNFLSGSLRQLRTLLPLGNKDENVEFARFYNEPAANECTELSSMPNGTVTSKSLTKQASVASQNDCTLERQQSFGEKGRYLSFAEEDEVQDESKTVNNSITEWQAGWNVTNAIQGMFIVTFPYAVVEGGYWAIFSMLFIAWICCYTGKILVECLYENGKRVRGSYVQIAEAVWGARIGGRIVHCAQLIELLMTCILYVLLCGDLMLGMMPDDSPIDLTSWIMLSTAMLLPCAFLSSLRHVSFLSFWCTVAHMFINAIILIYCFTRAEHWHWKEVQIRIDIWTFPISLGIVIFSFTSQIFLPTLEGNLRDRSRFRCMMHWTHLTAGVFKALFSYIGFLTWGMATMEVVTNNLPSKAMKIIVNLFLVAKALLSYPLPYFAALELLQNTWFRGDGTTPFPSCHDAAGKLKVWGLVLRLAVVLVTMLMAIFIPHFAILMGLIGSFTGNMLSLVWPCYFHLRIKYKELKLYQKLLDVSIILLGLVCAVLGCYYSSHALIRAFQGHEPKPFQGKYIQADSPNKYPGQNHGNPPWPHRKT